MSQKQPTSVVDGAVVSIHYVLTLDDGREVDSSRGRDPLLYLHGAQNIVPGLERQLTGLAVGATIQADVVPEEAYGARYPDAVQDVARTRFPADLELAPGMQIGAQAPDGSPLVLHVKAVAEDTVTVDLNHPLAGETLHFAVEVVAIRGASEEETTHGHPHGAGGHHH